MKILSLNRNARDNRRSADRTRIRPRLEALENRRLMTVNITEFPLPTANSGPWGIVAGTDGNLWFTETGTSRIGMINPTTHAISEFATPTASSAPVGITAGSDGNLWFVERDANKIGMINPTSHAISEFATPTRNSRPFWITAGPDGNVWFTEINSSKIGMINPTTHVFSEFPLPSGSNPQGITAGPDGNVWFTEFVGNKVGMINPITHVITEYPIPTANSTPRGITAGADGNLWFSELSNTAHQVGMINPTTRAISEFATPTTNSHPGGITAGPDGNIWFTKQYDGQIGKINPTTHTMTEYPIPYPTTDPYAITSGPDGNLWFTDNLANAIGVVTLNANNLVVTAQPPANVIAGSAFSLTVEAQDSSGNLMTSFNGTVALALASNPSGDTLGGTLTATASGGVASFSDLTLTKAASGYTLAASASGYGPGVTSAITMTPAVATQLVITQQPPSTVKLSTSFSMKASVQDAYGNAVTTASGSVSVAFASNPTGATLGGTLSVNVSQGVATFSNLTINKTGSGYTLQVSRSGLTSATSTAINVTKNGKASSATVAPMVTLAADLSLAPLLLDSPDIWDTVKLKRRSRFIAV